jgi:hypothetical protein
MAKKISINDEALQKEIDKEVYGIEVDINELLNSAAIRLGTNDRPNFEMIKKHLHKKLKERI